jgi:hypothetical protein
VTALLARIKATGEPIARLARRAEVSRGALSNVAYGRRTFSSATAARVESVLVKTEASRRERIAEREFAESVVSALTQGTP